MSRNFEVLEKLKQEQVLKREEAWVGAQFSNSPSKAISTPVLSQITRDELTKLVQRLFLAPRTPSIRSVVFSGVEPGDGCSRTCAQVVQVLASTISGSVCLVDANLGSPSLHEFFGVDNRRGLSDALCRNDGVREFAIQTAIPHLWLLTTGSSTSDLRDDINVDALHKLIAALSLDFDYVVVDAPAASTFPGLVALGQCTGGIVLVVKAGSTRREVVRRIKEEVEASDVSLLGAVLNERVFPIPDALYSRL